MRLAAHIVFLTVLCPLFLIGQSDLYTFGSEFDEFGEGITALQDGNFLVGGEADNPQISNQNMLVFSKISPQGEVIWSRYVYADQDLCGVSTDVYELSTGDIAAVYETGNCLVSTRASLLLLSAQGDLLWNTTLETENFHDTFRGLGEDIDGNILAVGTRRSNSFGSDDALVSRFDLQGNMLQSIQVGGSNNDHYTGICHTSDGRIHAVGNSQSFGPTRDIVVSTFDSELNHLETHHLDIGNNQSGFKILPIGNEVICTGYHDDGNFNGVLLKLDDQGELAWINVIDETEVLTFSGIERVGDEIIIAGRVGSQNTVAYHFDLSGNILQAYSLSQMHSAITEYWADNLTMLNNQTFAVSCSFDDGDSDLGLYVGSLPADPCGESYVPNSYTLSGDWESANPSTAPVPVSTPVDLTIVDVDFTSEDLECNEECAIQLEVDFENGCIGDTFQFTNLTTTSDGDFSSTWEFEDETITDWNTCFTFVTAGEHTFSLNVTHVDGLCSASSEYTVNVATEPTLQPLSDLTLCPGDEFELEIVASNFDLLTFNGNEVNGSIIVDQSGDHSVTAENGCASIETAFSVAIVQLPALEDLSEVLCSEESFTLEVPDYDNLFIDGVASSSPITFETEGEFLVSMDLEGCNADAMVSIALEEAPLLSPLENLVLCEGEAPLVVAQNTGGIATVEYWNNGLQQPSIQINSPGTYTYFAENNCGSDEISFTASEITNSLPLSSEFGICDGEEITIEMTEPLILLNGTLESTPIILNQAGSYTLELPEQACGYSSIFTIQENFSIPYIMPTSCIVDEDFDAYFWSPFHEIIEIEYEFSNGSNYDLTLIISDGCADYDTLSTSIAKCNCSWYVPNAFTPDLDGINEVFKPEIDCLMDEYQFEVWNRWGEQIFVSTSPEDFWTGNAFGGNHYVPDGVYTWRLNVLPSHSKDRIIETGHVVMIR